MFVVGGDVLVCLDHERQRSPRIDWFGRVETDEMTMDDGTQSPE